MGENIEFKLFEDKVVCSKPPKKWNASKPLKVYTHGLNAVIDGAKTEFVKGLISLSNKYFLHFKMDNISAWMEAYDGKYDVILLNWTNLAILKDWEGNWGTRNSIDVGQYLGYCLAALSNG